MEVIAVEAKAVVRIQAIRPAPILATQNQALHAHMSVAITHKCET